MAEDPPGVESVTDFPFPFMPPRRPEKNPVIAGFKIGLSVVPDDISYSLVTNYMLVYNPGSPFYTLVEFT